MHLTSVSIKALSRWHMIAAFEQLPLLGEVYEQFCVDLSSPVQFKSLMYTERLYL